MMSQQEACKTDKNAGGGPQVEPILEPVQLSCSPQLVGRCSLTCRASSHCGLGVWALCTPFRLRRCLRHPPRAPSRPVALSYCRCTHARATQASEPIALTPACAGARFSRGSTTSTILGLKASPTRPMTMSRRSGRRPILGLPSTTTWRTSTTACEFLSRARRAPS